MGTWTCFTVPVKTRMAGSLNDNGKPEGSGGAQKKRRVWTVVFIVALVVFVGSFVSLGVIWYSYYQGQQEYDDLAEYFSVADVDEAAEPDEVELVEDIENLDKLVVDWEALSAANPDVVAWVYVPGTAINYPVVHGSDNDYYLTHDFNGAAGWLANYGTIFMDYRNEPGWTDEAYFIYGHHMNDGSMFADIAGMSDQGRFDASRTVFLLSPQGNYRLRSFSLVSCGSDETIVQARFPDEQDRIAYVQDKINRSIVNVGAIPAAADITKYFAFTTCDNYEDGRLVLYAYIEDTTVTDLVGTIGLDEQNGLASGSVNEVGGQ